MRNFYQEGEPAVNVKETHNTLKGRGLSKNAICSSRSRRGARDAHRVNNPGDELGDETKKFLIWLRSYSSLFVSQLKLIIIGADAANDIF